MCEYKMKNNLHERCIYFILTSGDAHIEETYYATVKSVNLIKSISD